MKNGVNLIHADHLREWDISTDFRDGKGWVAKRPVGRTGLIHRFKMAWRVFTGRYDALVWHNQ